MPARSDVWPADIPALLPFLLLVEKTGNLLHNRLIGSALVRDLGQDPTGELTGTSLPDPNSAAEARAIFERVFTTGQPVFATGEFVFKSGDSHTMSLLALPLSDDGQHVNMAISTLIGRPRLCETPRGWLKDVPVNVCQISEVNTRAGLERLCTLWEERRFPAPALI